jgi:hypothetical protein
VGRELSELTDEMRIYIDRKVAAAFDAPEQVVTLALEMVHGEAEPSVLRPYAERFTQEAIAAHLREQASWPKVTDCDRLDAAFSEMTRNGIVCRHDFSCCGNCGVAEIGDEIRKEGQKGIKVRGYAFYHMQDTDRATEGGGLLLNYSALFGGSVAGVAIGREIEATLQSHGLTTEWNGNWNTRIGVKLDWKRRLPENSSESMLDRRPRLPSH